MTRYSGPLNNSSRIALCRCKICGYQPPPLKNYQTGQLVPDWNGLTPERICDECINEQLERDFDRSKA